MIFKEIKIPFEIKTRYYYLVAFILAVISFFFHFSALNQTSFSNGWDGYFYLVQIKSMVNNGSMHSPDSSLIYPFIYLGYLLSGDYVLALKIVISILTAIFVLAVAVFAARNDKKWFGIILIIWAAFSPQLTYFAAQYPKNLLGLILLVFFLSQLKSKKWYIPLGLFILTFFGHRITFVIAGIFFVLYFLTGKSRKWILIFFSAVFVLILFSLLFPGLLSIYDFERFSGEFSIFPQFAPWSFFSEFGNSYFTLFWKMELLLITLIFIAAFIFVMLTFFKKHLYNRFLVVFVLASSVLIFPFFVWSIDGFAIRLLFVFLLIVPLMLVFVPIKEKPLISILFGILIGSAGIFSDGSYSPENQDPPYGKYEAMAKRIIESEVETELIIGHKALAEYITFSIDIDVMPWEPDYEINEKKLWRIVADIQNQEVKFYLGRSNLDSVFRVGLTYFLMPEYKYKLLLENVMSDEGNEEIRQRLKSWKNPHEKRPYYLGKDRK